MSQPSSSSRPPGKPSPVPALLGIVALLAALAGAFAWVGGGFGARLTAQQMTNTIEAGKPHPGFRRAHAKGVCVAGSFTPSAQAPQLSRARVFTQANTPILGRLSIGGGDPHGADAKARVRSVALLLKTDDGQQWRTAMNSFPFFVVATPEGFQAQNLASAPDPATGKPDPARMAAFLDQYPEAKKFMAWAKSAPWSNSWANTRFNGVNSFWFTNAAGERHAVRWSLRPQAPFEELSAGQRAQADADFLSEEFNTRLARGPVKWDLVVTQAREGDPIDDPSQPWPADRTQVVAGTVTFTGTTPQDSGACRDINYDPTVLPDGMAPSKDPILAARAAVYSVSFNRRMHEIGTGQAPAATGAKGETR
ncbi:catalase family peroxidase [Pseudoxanthomonas spadix]|uniref:catalase family peroxidase n=1 Tax=Pseudoxanthomonas spadix TaxID=415229 RepID=UPI00031B3224|nr:catalase family peroxidase [Pseudoxanthomonas spadix]